METEHHISAPVPGSQPGKLLGGRAVVIALLLLSTFLLISTTPRSYAVSCTSQAEMKDRDRSAISSTALAIAASVEAGNSSAVKAETIPSVASNFEGISSSIQALQPLLNGAALRVASVYDLAAGDAKPGPDAAQDEIQFFCGAANAPHVSFTIAQLPPGHYAFATVEATGVNSPQRLALLLQAGGAEASKATPGVIKWQLAGFFPRPLLVAGPDGEPHDGVWYWQKARSYAKAGQPWNAYFYYQTAAYLLLPADFVGSSNFDRLGAEQTAAMPAGLPGVEAMTIPVQNAPASITNLHTDGSLGGLDLVVRYNTADASDPVAARARTVAVMKALLSVHPELKQAFHGVWAFADAQQQQSFALELPMASILE